MNDRKIKLIFISVSVGCLLLGLIGVTFAYFSSENTLANDFNAGKYKTTASENFVSPTNWKPGDTTPKTLKVKNEGNINMYVRVTYSESWKNKNGEDLPLEQNGNQVAIINFDNYDDWTCRIDGYCYYNNVLEPNEETSSLISSVTFNPLVVGDYVCNTVNDKITCTSTGDSYEGGTYTLTFQIETVQEEAIDELWANHTEQIFFNGQSYNSPEEFLSNPDNPPFYIETITEYLDTVDEYIDFVVTESLVQDYPSLNVGSYRFRPGGSTINQEQTQIVGYTVYNSDSTYYNDNVQAAKDAFGDSNCNDDGIYLYCLVDDIGVSIDARGQISIFNSDYECKCSVTGYGSCGPFVPA